MGVAFRAVGSIAAAAGTGGGATALTITAPACVVHDILIAVILSKSNTTISPPDGSWTSVSASNNTSAQRCSIWWKRATASGGNFTFTRASESINWYCVVIAWKGCRASATPIDATTPTTSANASGDSVTYATFNPAETTAFVVAVGVYNEDNTTAGSISGTDPTFTLRCDVESATGADGSIFGYDGSSTGAATGARSHTTTSTADAINIGVLFGLVTENITATPGTIALTITPNIPTVTATNNITVTPGTLALTVTPYIPTVTASNNITVVPGTLALTNTPYIPVVSISNNIAVTPGTLALVKTDYTPTITTTNNITATPATLALVKTDYAPTVTASNHITVTPGTLALTVTPYIPTVTASNHITVTLGTLALIKTDYTPTVTVSSSGNQLVTPGVLALNITSYAPTVTATEVQPPSSGLGGGGGGNYTRRRNRDYITMRRNRLNGLSDDELIGLLKTIASSGVLNDI